MKCPVCKSDRLNEERDCVVCGKCGFTTPLREYRLWIKVNQVQAHKKEKVVFRESNDSYLEMYATAVNVLHDRRAQALILVIILLITLLVIATTV